MVEMKKSKELTVLCLGFCADIADDIGEKQQEHYEAVSVRRGWLTFTWGLILWGPAGSGNISSLEVGGTVGGTVLAPDQKIMLPVATASFATLE